MPLPHEYQIPPPKHWQQLEEICYDLYREVYKTNNINMHGRRGQKQLGVDIYGQREDSDKYFGIQCKCKENRYGHILTHKELEKEVENAKGFHENLSELILVTTAKTDACIQKKARELSDKNVRDGSFSVRIESWDEIVQQICTHRTVLDKHFPNLLGQPSKPKFHLQTFKTPRAANKFYGRENDLSSLIYELESGSSVAINGVGGIGKSELVLQALNTSQSTRNVIWCSLDRYKSVDTLIMTLRQAFIVNGSPCDERDLPGLFDELDALIVFDGIEQGNLHELEDTITNWYNSTKTSQFIITSQVKLYTLPNLKSFHLGKISLSESKKLLKKSLAENSTIVSYGIDELLQFCDGHPLSIILCTALTNHYGNATSAFKYIKQKNSQLLSVPERDKHTRATSLDVCLQIAYETLSENSKMLLWALSEAPAGIITGMLVDDGFFEIENSSDAYASLRRWHFIYEARINENITETKMLTPIRKFVISKLRNEKPGYYQKVIKKLGRHFALHVAVLEDQLENPGNAPHIMWRYSKILPNLLNIIDHSLTLKEDKELNSIASTIASSIMPYYFVLGNYEVGAEVILKVASISLSMGNLATVNNLASQFICLAQRSYNKPLIKKAKSLLNKIEEQSKGTEQFADISLNKALLLVNRDPIAAESYLKPVLMELFDRLETLENEKNENQNEQEYQLLCENLSMALYILGTALLNQKKPQRALEAYEDSLSLLPNSMTAVNDGQIFHQIGNCLSELRNHEAAISCYIKAVEAFYYLEMKEYLSHSFTELGYNLVEVDFPDLKSEFSEDCILAGILDLIESTKEAFNTLSNIDNSRYSFTLRKIIGTIYFLTLTDNSEKLEKIENELLSEVIYPYKEEKIEKSDFMSIEIIEKTIKLFSHVKTIENEIKASGFISDKTEKEILKSKALLEINVPEQFMINDWLFIYLKRKLGERIVKGSEIMKFINHYERTKN